MNSNKARQSITKCAVWLKYKQKDEISLVLSYAGTKLNGLDFRAKLDAEETENLEKIKKMPIGSSKSQPSLKDVRNEYEKLKEQRMAENQKDSDEKMLQHWRINNPEYRQLQCKKRYDFTLLA